MLMPTCFIVEKAAISEYEIFSVSFNYHGMIILLKSYHKEEPNFIAYCEAQNPYLTRSWKLIEKFQILALNVFSSYIFQNWYF